MSILSHHAVVARKRARAYDPDATTYLGNLVSAGSDMTTANKSALNSLVLGLKADSLWSLITELYIMAGPDSLVGAMIKLKFTTSNTCQNINFVSGDYDRVSGLKGDGVTKYYNANIATNILGATSHCAYWNASDMETASGSWPTGDNYFALGSLSGGGSGLFVLDIFETFIAGRGFRSGADSGTDFPFITSGLIADGAISGSRRSTTDCEFYQDATSAQTATATVTPSPLSLDLYLFGLNFNDSLFGPTASRCRVAMIGSGMSDVQMAAFHARVETYLAALT
jgi:hypothetical protein